MLSRTAQRLGTSRRLLLTSCRADALHGPYSDAIATSASSAHHHRQLQNGQTTMLQAGFANLTSFRERSTLPLNTGVVFVPQQEAWVVERMGKFYKILRPGLNFLIPIIDSVRYVQNLKEMAFEIPQQSAVTSDNVQLSIDGVLYLRVDDPYKASYNIEDPQFSVTQLAQTSMRSEIGKIQLDSVFRERESLNTIIVSAINNATSPWGISCLRYEIRDIKIPSAVKEAMQLQVEAERRKRAQVLESEGARDAEVNVAQGQATAILTRARAKADALTAVSKAIKQDAAAFILAEQYVKAFSNLAKTNNTLILPSDVGNVNKMVAQAFQIYKSVSSAPRGGGSGSRGGPSGPPSGGIRSDLEDGYVSDLEDVIKEAASAATQPSYVTAPSTTKAKAAAASAAKQRR